MTDKTKDYLKLWGFTTLIALVMASMLFLLGAVVTPPSRATLRNLDDAARANHWQQAGLAFPQGDEMYWPAQELIITLQFTLGATIEFVPLEEDAGRTAMKERLIQIDEKLHWNARFETLAHEGGHLLQPPGLGQSERETFAEAVSYLVGGKFKHDSLFEAAKYLAVHKDALHILTDYGDEIRQAASVLAGGR